MRNAVLGALAEAEKPAIHPDCQGTEIDGIVHCDKCKKPRQALIHILGRPRKQWIMCDCMIEKSENEEQELKMRLQKEQIERLRVTGIKQPELREQTFENDNGKQPDNMKLCREYVNKFDEVYSQGTTMLFYGPNGTGKSYAANSIANALIDKGIPVLITSFSIIAESLMAAPFEERATYYADLNKYPLIVIDDLGAERNTEFVHEVIFRVFTDRENSKKPMICSTNLSIEFFKDPPDDDWRRICSRLWKKCFPVKFDGVDQRKKSFVTHYNSMKDILKPQKQI